METKNTTFKHREETPATQSKTQSSSSCSQSVIERRIAVMWLSVASKRHHWVMYSLLQIKQRSANDTLHGCLAVRCRCHHPCYAPGSEGITVHAPYAPSVWKQHCGINTQLRVRLRLLLGAICQWRAQVKSQVKSRAEKPKLCWLHALRVSSDWPKWLYLIYLFLRMWNLIQVMSKSLCECHIWFSLYTHIHTNTHTHKDYI